MQYDWFSFQDDQEIIEEEYTIEIHREPGQGLGISIAGGKGSTPYKGEDEVGGVKPNLD